MRNETEFIKSTSERTLTAKAYNLVQLLLEYHLDVFGLIEKNLAIDINTLNK